MNQKNSFVISQFTNPSGDVVFRVSGWLDGKRVRKNFPTRAEAESERQALEVQRVQCETGVRVAATRLNDDQIQEAEIAFRRLGENPPRSLLFYLDYALANYREPQNQKKLFEAVTEYIAEKAKQQSRGLVSDLQLRDIKNGLKWLKERCRRGRLCNGRSLGVCIGQRRKDGRWKLPKRSQRRSAALR